ncbi:SMI1/KNR4 family protein [Actinokineospora iranica]|uniref:Knr4/Smi1-like domain-containing protein n=1 Tax=Actinokineospora iranica TaxID=1271860 RepID=A0A1G6ZES2_9PSEU|nr:SMI1/KNR4 family protein [Actinokineospora iranica]SDE01148.1 hypothetical protein SAMN05216174_1303 [Actinokineospora iranica]
MNDLAGLLVELGLACQDTIVGCTAAEIEQVRADQGGALPEQYEQFLAVMGRSAGELLRGTDFFYPSILGLPTDGRELLVENDATGLLGDGSTIIGMHQGYELYWLDSAGTLFWYKEGNKTTHRDWPSLLAFLEDQARTQASR